MSTPPPPPRRRAPGPADSNTPSPPPVDPAARAARRAESKSGSSRSRLLLAGVVLVAVALIAVGVVVVSGGDGGKDAPPVDTSTSVQLTVGELLVESVNPFEGNFPPAASEAAMAQIEAYVQAATVEPLRSGAVVDTGLAKIFDDAAVAHLATTDRAVLLDEGLPKATGKVTVEGVPIELTVLLDLNKVPVLITATIDLEITAQSKKGLITVQRTGTLVLAPQLDASWKITAWTLHVERGGPGVIATPPDSTPTDSTPTDSTPTTLVTP